MKTIKDVLEELLSCISCGINADVEDGFGKCTCGNEKSINQALKEIKTILDSTKPIEYIPNDDKNMFVAAENCGREFAANEYQANIGKVIGL